MSDPEKGLAALRRYNVTFTEAQEKIIKGHIEENDKVAARSKLLDIVSAQYKGSAEALALTDYGRFEQLKNQIGDLKEEFGGLVFDALEPYIGKIKSIIDWTHNLDDENKELISKLGVLGTAFLVATTAIYVFNVALTVLRGVLSTTGGLVGTLATVLITASLLMADELDWLGGEFLTFEDKATIAMGRVGQVMVGGFLGINAAALVTIATLADVVNSLDDLILRGEFQTDNIDLVYDKFINPAGEWYDTRTDEFLGHFDAKNEEERKRREDAEAAAEELINSFQDVGAEGEVILPETEKEKGRNTEKEAALFAVLANLLSVLIAEVEEGNEILRQVAIKMGVAQANVAQGQFATVTNVGTGG